MPSPLLFYRLELVQPLLQQHEMEAVKHLAINGWRTKTLDATWPVHEGPLGLESALQRLADEANAAIDEGFSFLAISDRDAGELLPEWDALPAGWSTD